MKDIVIYGAGGLGREILTVIEAINVVKCRWNFLGFIDDQLIDHNVVGNLDYVNFSTRPLAVVVAIGNPLIKQKVVDRIRGSLINFPVLIHPKSIVSPNNNIEVEDGTVITAGVVLTTNVSIGKHVLINLNTTIGHDTKVGSYTSIMPGVNISGEVTLEEKVFVGAGSNIINRLHVGIGATIGAGAVVIKNVEKETTVVGVPAKAI